MTILICGDSWTAGCGVGLDFSWPTYLDCDVKNVAKNGSTNQEIFEQFLKHYNTNYNAVIIGWSGVTRIIDVNRYEFSAVNRDTINFFEKKSLTDLIESWQSMIDKIIKICNKPILQFSVFGDKPYKKYNNFIEISCLEYLANEQGCKFNYNIPIFEFDWLNKNNYLLTKKFAKKYFDKTWQKAIVEREIIRDTKNFLICGHPSQQGQHIWGNFIKKKLNDILE